MTRHHLIPQERARKKNYTKDDLQVDRVLNLWDDSHAAWHFLFRNMTLSEIIECLKRIKRIKSR